MRDPVRTALSAMMLWLGVIWAGAPSPAAGQEAETANAAESASETVLQVANWAIASGDNGGSPFLIIDKVAAAVFVFGADGQLLGAAPALLGFARGDDSVPGIGDRPLATIRPDERTTPAGRFPARFGPATGKHKVVLWVDYEASVSLHPVITEHREEHRLQRLKSPSPEDNRITYGCINVAAAYYDDVVRPTFGNTRGIVYILPETKLLHEVFPALQLQARARTARKRHS